MTPRRLHLITGGKFHDFDYARLNLLQLIAEDDAIRTSCAQDFSQMAELQQQGVNGLILYTCDLIPDQEQTKSLVEFVRKGGRLFAIHAVNAPIEFTDGPAVVTNGVNIPGLVKAPGSEIAPDYMALLGSRFQAHLPSQALKVEIEDREHPVTQGLSDFTVIDEPYMFEPVGDIKVLMSARYKGEATGYELGWWNDDLPRPQLYTKTHGAGEILYTTLGHCCGRFDMQPLMEEAPINRGPWENAIYRELLRRGIQWAAAGGQAST